VKPFFLLFSANDDAANGGLGIDAKRIFEPQAARTRREASLAGERRRAQCEFSVLAMATAGAIGRSMSGNIDGLF
jgi:hypothetical protein